MGGSMNERFVHAHITKLMAHLFDSLIKKKNPVFEYVYLPFLPDNIKE